MKRKIQKLIVLFSQLAFSSTLFLLILVSPQFYSYVYRFLKVDTCKMMVNGNFSVYMWEFAFAGALYTLCTPDCMSEVHLCQGTSE